MAKNCSSDSLLGQNPLQKYDQGKKRKPSCFGGYRLFQVFCPQAHSTFRSRRNGLLSEQSPKGGQRHGCHGGKENTLRGRVPKLGADARNDRSPRIKGDSLFRTSLTSKAFTTEVTVMLEERFAPRSTYHGTLLDIRGIGTLIRGDSGSGKSEAALALIERGHSLVADDMVRVKLLSDHTPVGFCDDMSRGFMECRGIGIINIEELFGIRFVRLEKRIDLVVTFLEDSSKEEPDRTGLDRKTFDLLGIEVPHMEIPLRPGRDMARLVEVAAMVQSARQLGHDSANDFNEKLLKKMNG